MTTESGDEEIQILVGAEDPVVVCKTATGLGIELSEALEEQNSLRLLQLRYSLTENKQIMMSLTVVLVLVASYINTKSREELVNSTHFIPIHALAVSVVAVFSCSLAASAFTCVYPHVAKWFEAYHLSKEWYNSNS